MKHDAWNPGLTSEIPASLLPIVTLYQPENSTVGYEEAKKAAAFCGLKPADMVAFTLERLITHELLIRVTADLSVPDGPDYEELGLNLRGMVAQIYQVHVVPELDRLRSEMEAVKVQALPLMQSALEGAFALEVKPERPNGFFERLLGGKEARSETQTQQIDPLAKLEIKRGSVSDPAQVSAMDALIRIGRGIASTHGRLLPDQALLIRFAMNHFMNDFGAQCVAREIAPIIKRAARVEGYRFLPPQEKPFFMNVKGASASGKSTIRPQQRALAGKLNIPWEDFALISPDYWRKYLLDYDSLGEDYKYAAMLTGQELEIIDKKLDAYIEAKASRNAIPHLLIDRFRFDSFATDDAGQISSRLLTRFGDTVFLYFLVTPPAATVERAWSRGLETGRFKAVDDLLYHNIEAYTGMPQLFFSWLGSAEKMIHFEFLDNSVPYGERPRTIAYGWNDRMVVLDVEGLHNIDRFRAVNVEAQRAEDVLLPSPEMTFFERCAKRFDALSVVDPKTGVVSAQAVSGEWLKPKDFQAVEASTLDADRGLTIGAWR